MIFPKELVLPHKTIIEQGASLRIADEVRIFGKRGLIVHGHSLTNKGKWKEILSRFSSSEKVVTYCHKSGEPTLTNITDIIAHAHEIDAQWIVGIGGGSVLDVAKAAAGLYHARELPRYYQEGGRLEYTGIPFVAVPTTAGTGSEVTINSVIINPEKKVKRSIRDKNFLAHTVILDSSLLVGMPQSVLKHAALDALVQGYESYISRNATWFTEQYALKAIELINYHIIPAYESGSEDDCAPLLIGSYSAGIALAHARLGVIHGIAHPLGALYDLPHGLICSVCFIPSLKLNRDVMGKKYDTVSECIGMDLLERAHQLIETLGVVSPFKGKKVIEREKIIEETLISGSTAANPKPIQREDVEFLLNELFIS